MSSLSRFRPYVIIFTFLIVSYFFFVYFTPYIAKAYFPNWQKYLEGAHEHDIETGALFYSDVPVTADAVYNFRVKLKGER